MATNNNDNNFRNRVREMWRAAASTAGRAVEAGQQVVEGDEAPLVLGVIFLILIAL